MVLETKFRKKCLNTRNKEIIEWKAPKTGFQNRNKIEYKGINLKKSLIPGTHLDRSNFKEFTKLIKILTVLYI